MPVMPSPRRRAAPRPARRNVSADVEETSPGGYRPAYGASWAVVIGINGYARIRPLDYAVNDAIGVADLLVTRLGFPKDQVFVLLDPPPAELPASIALCGPSAAKNVIEDLLFTQLPNRVGPDDRLLVFFAGHGERRTLPNGQTHIGYLAPVDAEPDRWHTYVEMDAVLRAGNFCAAKHVFYLLDACYSGLATARGDVRPARYQEDMLTSRARQVLTAGTARQAVADKGPHGHSLFTWHVLQGLRGDADQNGDQVITASDLMVYVKNQVALAYDSEQTPDFGALAGHESGGDFVFTAPKGGLTGAERVALGGRLTSLARAVDDPAPLRYALAQYAAALESAAPGSAVALEALRERGRCLAELGDPAAATALRKTALRHDPAARLQLGLAYARQRDNAAAVPVLEDFLKRNPGHEDAGWVAPYLAALKRGGGRKHAVLVGVGELAHFPQAGLKGPPNDVRAMRDLLIGRFGFDPSNVTMLVDRDATRQAIVEALSALVQRAVPPDTVLFYYSGHGSQAPNTLVGYPSPDAKLGLYIPHDLRQRAGGWDNALTEADVDAIFTRIPARDKLIITDGDHLSAPADLSGDPKGYRFLSGCRRDQTSADARIGDHYSGAFTHFLVEHLGRADSEDLSGGKVLMAVAAGLKQGGYWQEPQYFGDPQRPLLSTEPERDWLAACDFARRRNYRAIGPGQLLAWRARLEEAAVPFPAAWESLGRAHLSRGEYAMAADALARVASPERPGAQLALGLAQLGAQRYAEAAATLTARAEALATGTAQPGAAASLMRGLAGVARRLPSTRKRALVVGIDAYAEPTLPRLRQAMADAEALRQALVDRRGFKHDDVVLLLNEAAGRDAILDAFSAMVEASRQPDALAVFAFVGLGAPSSVFTNALDQLIPADGRIAGKPGGYDIALSEVWGRGAVVPNLTVLIDLHGVLEADPSRAIPAAESLDDGGSGWRPGQVAVYASSAAVGHLTRPRRRAAAARAPSRRRAGTPIDTATRRLLDGLEKADPAGLSYDEWVVRAKHAAAQGDAAGGGSVIEALGDTRQPAFANAALRAEAFRLGQEVERAPLREMIGWLDELVRRDEGLSPESHLNLGLASAAVGEIDRAVAAFEEAIRQRGRQAPERDEQGYVVYPEAHYHLGRVLFESGRDRNRAVSELRQSKRQDRDNPRVYYYLGMAIRELIEKEDSVDAANVLQAYLDKGAPLGDEENVRQYIMAVRSRGVNPSTSTST